MRSSVVFRCSKLQSRKLVLRYYQVNSTLPVMFLLSQLFCRWTPKPQLCYGTVLVMLLIYPLVTNEAANYKKIQIKEPVYFALLTTLIMPFLCNVCYDFKLTLKWSECLLFTLLTSTQANQTKTKQYQTYDATNYSIEQPLNPRN